MYKYNSGYDGQSMSNRARAAYSEGRKPLSKYDSDDLEYFNDRLLLDRGIKKKVKNVQCLKQLLRNTRYYSNEWHHTGKYFNKTDFYDLDLTLENVSEEEIELANNYKKEEEVRVYFGDLEYLTWEGTRKHPRAYKHRLDNVYIKEKGCFYYIYNNFELKDQILKKMINSNGTYIKNEVLILINDELQIANDLLKDIVKNKDEILQKQEEEKRLEAEREREIKRKNEVLYFKEMYKNSDQGFKEFFDGLGDSEFEISNSGNVYPYGKKPNPIDYEDLESFFSVGDRKYRLDFRSNINEYGYETYEWNGQRFEKMIDEIDNEIGSFNQSELNIVEGIENIESEDELVEN